MAQIIYVLYSVPALTEKSFESSPNVGEEKGWGGNGRFSALVSESIFEKV